MGKGESPNVFHGTHADYKKLFYSDPMQALRMPVTLQAGYGVLPLGMVMAKNGSAAGNKNKLIPYNPTAVTGEEDAPGRAYLVQDSGAGATLLYTTIEDSYKFAVGDDLMIDDDTTTAENLGAITAIDRTTYTNRAKITVTTATGGTSFTAARFAYVYCEGADTAVGILDAARDTGEGEDCVGAMGSVILAHAIMYTGMLVNLDAAAKVELATAEWGQYTYLK